MILFYFDDDSLRSDGHSILTTHDSGRNTTLIAVCCPISGLLSFKNSKKKNMIKFYVKDCTKALRQVAFKVLRSRHTK